MPREGADAAHWGGEVAALAVRLWQECDEGGGEARAMILVCGAGRGTWASDVKMSGREARGAQPSCS